MIEQDDNKENKIDIPLVFEGASEEIKGWWIERAKLQRELDEHPMRYYSIINDDGEEVAVDCKGAAHFMRKKVEYECPSKPDEEVEEIMKEVSERRAFFQDNYYRKMIPLTRKINTLIKQEGKFNLLDLKEEDLLEMFGKFYTIDEVTHIVNKEWGYSLPKTNIMRWAKQHEAKIDQYKADYLLKNKEFRIATETGRLEVLNDLLSHYQTKFNRKEAESTANMVLKVLEQGRREVKGNELQLTIDGKIDINATLQGAGNITEISKKLPINMLIIGLVAAKQGLNPLSIMTSLATSYYKNYNGFGNELSDKDIESPANLIKNYNFHELERKHNEYKAKQKERLITDIVEIKNEEEKQGALKTKNSLLESLRKAQK